MELEAELIAHYSAAAETGRCHDERIRLCGDLIASLGHEFNNLLTAVTGSLGILRSDLGAIEGQAESLILVDDALSASRDGSEILSKLLTCMGRDAIRPEPVVLTDLMSDLSALLDQSLPVEIELSVSADHSLEAVWSDCGRLESVILDLVVNAREAMPTGGKLTIQSCSVAIGNLQTGKTEGIECGEYGIVRVSDTGIGIEPQDLARVYDPFYTTKVPRTGRGFGLSMAYGFIRQSGGYLLLHSHSGPGTTATLLIPAAATASCESNVSSGNISQPPVT